MSMRCALMSSRPSSNTAKRPMGPAPMMTTSVDNTSLMQIPLFLSLLRGRRHGEAVQFIADLDLAGEPGIGPHLEGEIEHVLLHLGGLARLFRPFLGDVDMTGRAGASAPAFGLDARNRVAERRLHDRCADLRVDGARLSGRVNERDLGHRNEFFLGKTAARAVTRLLAFKA